MQSRDDGGVVVMRCEVLNRIPYCTYVWNELPQELDGIVASCGHVFHVVSKDQQRLSKDAKARPEGKVTRPGVLQFEQLVDDELLDDDHEELDEHGQECPVGDPTDGSGDDILVAQCRNEEDEATCELLGKALSSSQSYLVDHGVVDMSHEPVVHGNVPQSPVLASILAVPPLLVEFAITEPSQLSSKVQEELET